MLATLHFANKAKAIIEFDRDDYGNCLWKEHIAEAIKKHYNEIEAFSSKVINVRVH